jgi:hypothetical protein
MKILIVMMEHMNLINPITLNNMDMINLMTKTHLLIKMLNITLSS